MAFFVTSARLVYSIEERFGWGNVTGIEIVVWELCGRSFLDSFFLDY